MIAERGVWVRAAERLGVRDTSTKSWLLKSDIPEATRPAGGRRTLAKVMLLGTGGLVAAIVVAALFLYPDGDEDLTPDSALVVAAEGRSAVFADAAVAEPAPAVAAVEEQALPEEITIIVDGTPKGARIFVDDREVERPIKIASSDQPIILKVSAPGYDRFVKAIVPNEDSRLDVAMQRSRSRTRSGTRKGKQAAKEGAETVWAENPFAE